MNLRTLSMFLVAVLTIALVSAFATVGLDSAAAQRVASDPVDRWVAMAGLVLTGIALGYSLSALRDARNVQSK